MDGTEISKIRRFIVQNKSLLCKKNNPRYKDALMAALAEGWGRTIADVVGYQSYLPSWEVYT